MFFEHKALYTSEGPVTDFEEALVPIGRANLITTGKDITVVAAGSTVTTCLRAMKQLAEERIKADVIDLRTLSPLDTATIFSSVEKTGRLMIVEEDVGFCGWGAEIAAQVAEHCLYSLKSHVRRITAPYSPVPFSPALEKFFSPSEETVIQAARTMIKEG